ncbi:hypothetical protein D3C86_1538530 [compost metagenome]
MLQLVDAERSGQARGTQHHGLTQGQALRPFQRPGRGNPDVLGEAARGIHAQVITGHYHLIAHAEFGDARLLDHTRRVDARGMRKMPGHTTVATGGQGILVVQRRIANPDQQFAGRQFADAALNNRLLELTRRMFADL